MDVNQVEQVDIIYKRPNLLLLITSSLFIIPVCLNYLTEHESFKKNRHESFWWKVIFLQHFYLSDRIKKVKC